MTRTRSNLAIAIALLIGSAASADESLPFGGRISLFGMTQSASYDDGRNSDFSELIGWVSVRSGTAADGGLEYEFDLRSSTYPSGDRDDRTRVYDAWVGGRTAGGRFKLRAGQMWINELGGLGSVGGIMAEYRSPVERSFGRLRFGLFGGLEPETYDFDYVSDVKKGGAWIAIDGEGSRRHVLGYVQIRDDSLTERSVLTTTNFIPVGKTLYLYQAAEYDIEGPGGEGSGGLRYFFTNARYKAGRRVELLGTYHKGRSIDARTITQDILNGRPIDQKSLDGYLYESVGGRVTVSVMKNLRVYAGYASDRNNREDESSGRITAGMWASDIAGSGFDLSLSDNRIDRPGRTYDAWYASLGRNVGSRLYLSVDYATSLSVVRIVDQGGAVVETRPETTRVGFHALWNINRRFSLLVDAEELDDDKSKDTRTQVGLTYRF